MKKLTVLFLSLFLMGGIMTCDDDVGDEIEDELEDSAHQIEQVEVQSTDFFLA